MGIVLFASFFISHCSLADLRTELIKSASDPDELHQKGSLVLKAMVGSYGNKQRWLAKKNAAMVFRDTWHGFLGKNLFMPWDKNGHKMQLAWKIGTDNSRLMFLEEPNKGHEWGVQNWASYTKEPDGPIHFANDSKIKFNLSTIQFFMTAHFRLSQTDAFAYAGEKQWNDANYDLVLVSWETIAPQKDTDQYLLWINQQNRRLEVLEFTIREYAGFLTGIMLYSDFREEGGILFPFRMTAVEDLKDREVLHELAIESVRFDPTLPTAYFMPDPQKSVNKY